MAGRLLHFRGWKGRCENGRTGTGRLGRKAKNDLVVPGWGEEEGGVGGRGRKSEEWGGVAGN